MNARGRVPGFAEPALELVCRGVTYRVPPVSIPDGVRLFDLDDSGGPREARTIALGAAADAMRADNVPALFYLRAGEAALADFLAGRKHAEQVWLLGWQEAGRRQQQAPEGLAALAEYGWGEQDPVTGLFEGYDLPPEMAATEGSEAVFSWPALFEAWDVVEQAFAQAGLDLEQAWETRTWRWFAVQVRGLLATDTVLASHFQPEATAGAAASGSAAPAPPD